jgi:hypothetical protein
MSQYSLITSGDFFETHYYPLFIQKEFPSYEVFWQKYIVPLTGRPNNIHFNDDADLKSIGKSDHDICIAQLHYSVLRHLARAYDQRKAPNLNIDNVFCALSALCAAQDVSFELLERFRKPGKYDPWANKKQGRQFAGRDAQEQWKKSNRYPLQHIRNYRNSLIHARMLPGIQQGKDVFLPKIGRETDYYDWRKITNASTPSQMTMNDFAKIDEILQTSWDQTIQYLELQWKSHLLPRI